MDMTTVARRASVLVALAVFFASATSTPAGSLTLTPIAIAEGFKLTTFATGFPTGGTFGESPLGIAFPTTGGVLVSDNPGNVRFFAQDKDGQSAGSAPIGQSFGLENAAGMASVNGKIYMTQYANGQLVQLNANGTLNQVVVNGVTPMVGIVANPVNGHLYVSTVATDEILDINPVSKSFRILLHGDADGLTLSADGSTLYGAAPDGRIHGVSTATGMFTYDSGPGQINASGIDGIALGYGNLAGNLFINSNDGKVTELNLATRTQTLLASGGTRGDFVTADPNNGSLLLTQALEIDRLIAPAGGGFGNPPSAVPEPGTLTLCCSAIGIFVLYRRNRGPAFRSRPEFIQSF
jgi:hypothetical protein